MNASDRTGDQVTVLRPRASRGGLVTTGLLLLVVGVFGDLLELLAYLFAPFTRIPAVRRWLAKDDAPPDQLEVRADRVAAVGSQAGREIRRVAGAVTYPPTPVAPATGAAEKIPDFQVVLRDGWIRPLPAKAIVATVLTGTGVAIVAHFVASFAVDADRIVVRYGATAELAVTRRSVVSGVVGRRWLRLRLDGQWRATYLPVAPRRRELATALVAYGWPVTVDS